MRLNWMKWTEGRQGDERVAPEAVVPDPGIAQSETGEGVPVAQAAAEVRAGWGPRDWFLALLLVLATLLAYQPAWHGKQLWDDQAHLTQPEMRSLEGLARIWTEVGATQAVPIR